MPSPEELFDSRDFQYSASGISISGRIKRPISDLIQVPACVLPPAGGRTSARVDKFQFGEVLRVDSARADAFGEFDQKAESWRTGVHVFLRGCNLFGVVEIGRIEAILSSSYPIKVGLPRFVVETSFEDFRIGRTHVDISIEQGLSREPTDYAEFLKSELAARRRERMRKDRGSAVPIITSLVSDLKFESKDNLQVEGHIIHVPRLGRIRLVELVVEPERRILTMLRIELDGGGEIDLGTIIVNGISSRSSWQREWEEKDERDRSTGLEPDEETEVIDDLKHWRDTNPKQDEPFLFFMGRSLTPKQFFQHVEEKTDFGVSFLRFLAEQSKESGERPRDVIRRAVDANKAE